MSTTLVRRPAVAGQFYTDNPEELRSQVMRFIEDSKVEPAPERVAAIVVPHAGYRYSGHTAGYAYARVMGKKVKRVVLLGCSHHFRIDKASIFDHGVFDTPLGPFPIDEDFAKVLSQETGATSLTPHEPEHSLEVQFPFLAVAIGHAPVVPVLFGSMASDWHARWGERLASLMDDSDLLVVSTDLSHYHSETEANTLDNHSLDVLLQKDWKTFAESVRTGQSSMCGATAVAVGMAQACAKGATDWKVLDYRTSAFASRDRHRVVGYAAVSMEKPA